MKVKVKAVIVLVTLLFIVITTVYFYFTTFIKAGYPVRGNRLVFDTKIEKQKLNDIFKRYPDPSTYLYPISLMYLHQYPNDIIQHYFYKYASTELSFLPGIGTTAKEIYYAENVYNQVDFQKHFYLWYRFDKQVYLIDLTPYQQREIINKLIEIGYFELDNFWDINGLYRAIRNYSNGRNYKLFDQEYKGIIFNNLVFIDDTPKNKLTIETFKYWLDSKYKTELLKHPVDKWPED